MVRSEAPAASRSGWLLAVLMSLLAFEPRRLALVLPGMRVSPLEAVAAVALLALALEHRLRLGRLLRRPPLPLLLLLAFVATHWLSAAQAEPPRSLPLKFSLRMTACLAFAFVVAACSSRLQERGLRAYAWMSLVVATLAILEGAGVRGVDPLLDVFRFSPVEVGSTRRATGGSEYPNLAAGMLVSGLLAWAGLAIRFRWAPVVLGLVSVGLLFTYSRAVVGAAFIGLGALWLAQRRAGGGARGPALGLGALVLGILGFAVASETFRLRLRHEGSRGWYAARYSVGARELSLSPGESRLVRVELENAGFASWRRAEARLGQRWLEPRTGRLRDAEGGVLPRDVAPGERAAVSIELRAPSAPGWHQVVLEMRVGQRWFSEGGDNPASLSIRVGDEIAPAPAAPPALPKAVLPEYWQPDRAHFTRMALQMWRDRPLTGVGSDNFRWQHARYAGREDLDPWAYASNAFLEVAATTGAFGLLAFSGTLAAASWGVFAALRRQPRGSQRAAWNALLVGQTAALVAQNAVDYFLAATGHYLYFAFVIGAVARATEERE